MKGTKSLIFVAIVVSVTGMAAGVFLAGDLAPSRAAHALGQYEERVTANKTVVKVVHEHDGLPRHEHAMTIATTTNETTPHGYFHDFARQAGQAPASASPVEMPTPAPAPAAAIPAQGARAIVVESREFRPSSLSVPVGSKVTWLNKDLEVHVLIGDNGLFSTTLEPGGGTFSYTFDAPGTFSYRCDTHPHMTGTIIVTGTPVAGANVTGANVTANMTAPTVNLGRHMSE